MGADWTVQRRGVKLAFLSRPDALEVWEMIGRHPNACLVPDAIQLESDFRGREAGNADAQGVPRADGHRF
jgi:hypothetical protein